MPTQLKTTLFTVTLAATTLLAQTPVQPEYTIQARVPLTYVDVVVTDAQGHPVRGLKQSDFILLEDGQPMTLNSFGEHRTDLPTSEPAVATLPEQPLDTFTNVISNPASGRPINILLIDNLNTPTQVQQRVQSEMLAYVRKMPAACSSCRASPAILG
jgi:VWFA-related protein